jgi:hypothetical protein
MMSSIGSAISRLLLTSYRWLTPYAAFVNGDTTMAGAGRRRSSTACRDGSGACREVPLSNVTQSPTSHPSCVSGFCLSSPHALNNPAAITVMIPRRQISLCSPVHLAELRHLSLSLSLGRFGRQRRARPTARRCAEGDLPEATERRLRRGTTGNRCPRTRGHIDVGRRPDVPDGVTLPGSGDMPTVRGPSALRVHRRAAPSRRAANWLTCRSARSVLRNRRPSQRRTGGGRVTRHDRNTPQREAQQLQQRGAARVQQRIL